MVNLNLTQEAIRSLYKFEKVCDRSKILERGIPNIPSHEKGGNGYTIGRHFGRRMNSKTERSHNCLQISSWVGGGMLGPDNQSYLRSYYKVKKSHPLYPSCSHTHLSRFQIDFLGVWCRWEKLSRWFWHGIQRRIKSKILIPGDLSSDPWVDWDEWEL